MKFSTSISIDATPDQIWDILTDADAYPEWDPGMIRLEGEIAPGNKITAHTKISPCLLYTSPSPRDGLLSRMPSSA